MWTESEIPLPADSFVWGPGQPNNYGGYQHYLSFKIYPDEEEFSGNDKHYGSKNYPLCQQKE